MRFKEIMEVAVARNDPEMDDYNSERDEKAQEMRDAPYYVSWQAQSYEWYGEGDPADGNGRYKAKGDGGRIVAINIPTYAEASAVAKKLDRDYENGKFEDENVYSKSGEDYYTLTYHGTDISSMSRMDDFEKETIARVHDSQKPIDFG